MVVRAMPSAAVLGYYESMISGMTTVSPERPDDPGLDGDHRTRRRYHVVVAENSQKFPDSMSLSQLVLYSPGCLKQVRQIVQDRPSYIVPGISSTHEKQLCVHLGIPLLGNDPSTHPQHCNRISARKLFTSVGAAVPVGAHLAPLTTTYEADTNRLAEFERLKRKALRRLSTLDAKRRRAFNRLGAAIAVNKIDTERRRHTSAAAHTEEEVEFLDDIPGIYLSIESAVAQNQPDLVGLWLTIAHVMLHNLETQRWLLKIADQTEGRGQAVIHSADFQGLLEENERRRRWGYKLEGDSVPRNTILDFAAELAIEVPRLARLSGSAQACYGDWDHYFESLTREGAVLEGTPVMPQARVIGCSASLVIEPSSADSCGDNWELLQLIERRSVVDDDTIHGDGPSLWLFPLGCQDGTPASAGYAQRKAAAERTAQARRAAMHMTKLCKLVAPELARRGVRGYVTIDAVAFNDSPTPQCQLAPEDPDGHDTRSITPISNVRASAELWATDICFGYTDRLVSWEVAHAILQGSYMPGAGLYSVRSGSFHRCMAGCRIISPHVDKILGGRGGGLTSFFRWANISGQRQDIDPGDGLADASMGQLGCQYDISAQLGGLFALPPCAMDGAKPTGTQGRRNHRISMLRKTKMPEAMGLTIVAADTANGWSMLRNTLQWVEYTRVNGPAREVAAHVRPQESPGSLQAHSARGSAPSVERCEEEDNLHSLLQLASAVAQ